MLELDKGSKPTNGPEDDFFHSISDEDDLYSPNKLWLGHFYLDQSCDGVTAQQIVCINQKPLNWLALLVLLFFHVVQIKAHVTSITICLLLIHNLKHKII